MLKYQDKKFGMMHIYSNFINCDKEKEKKLQIDPIVPVPCVIEQSHDIFSISIRLDHVNVIYVMSMQFVTSCQQNFILIVSSMTYQHCISMTTIIINIT